MASQTIQPVQAQTPGQPNRAADPFENDNLFQRPRTDERYRDLEIDPLRPAPRSAPQFPAQEESEPETMPAPSLDPSEESPLLPETTEPRSDDDSPFRDDNLTQPRPSLDEPLPSDPFADESPRSQLTLERGRAQCAEELAKFKANRLSTIGLDIAVDGQEGDDFPIECSLDGETFQPRHWAATTFEWKASNLCHKPLYFEDIHLERYGHEAGPFGQPLISGAHFFATLPILPYKMGLRTPNECVYALGYYRPGNCAPYLIDPIPFTLRAAIFEAGAWVGGAAIIP